MTTNVVISIKFQEAYIIVSSCTSINLFSLHCCRITKIFLTYKFDNHILYILFLSVIKYGYEFVI